MNKKHVSKPLFLGLTALLLGTQPALAADIIELHTPGGNVRRFTLDQEHVLQLSGEHASQTRIRRANRVERKALGQLKGADGRYGSLDGAQTRAGELSPVLRDAGGRAYGLPGGLIITFHSPAPDDEQARAQLKKAGLVPLHPITPGIWAVKSPAGLASLKLANQLNAQGLFAEVQPNWWVKRALK